MEEDWGAMSSKSARPTFTLFQRVSPEEAASRDSFVDIIIYNRWSKAERKLYQRLKADNIARRIAQQQFDSIDDIADSLGQLNLLKSNNPDQLDPAIDDLIGALESMKLKHHGTKNQ